MKKLSAWSLAFALGIFLAAGCTPEAANETNQAAQNTANQADRAEDKAENAAKNTGQAAENTAENAGQAAGNVAKEAGEAVGGAAMTGTVKSALIAANDLDATKINVDTHDNTVHLQGTVPSEDQKKRAETIAKTIAGKDYTIKNDLKVGGGDKSATK